MGLTFRLLQEDDYDNFLTQWWKDWRWTPPPKDFLPTDGLRGVVILTEEGEPILVGHIYTTNAPVAWLDWVISDFNFKDGEVRKQAMNLLIDSSCEILKSAGIKYIYALIKHEGLKNSYKQHGFTEGDSYSSEMIKKL